MLKMLHYTVKIYTVFRNGGLFYNNIIGIKGKYLNATPEEIGMLYLIEEVYVVPKTFLLTIQSGKITTYLKQLRR